MKNVFFSIIIPVYNAEKYISRSIESVINQTFNNIEIIIIDDCSNDKSLSIVKKYAAENPKIKLIINKTNRGTFYTRIMAIHKARGQYILFLDSDDEIDCNTCKHIYNIVKNSKVDIIQYQTFYGKSLQTMRKHFSSKGKRFLVGNKCILFNFFSREISGNLCGKAFKKELFNDALKLINFYSNIHLNYHEDFIICFAFCCVAQTYISTTNGKYYYYENSDSLTHTFLKSYDKWSKTCKDLVNCRQIILKCAENANLDIEEVSKLEKLYSINFNWYFNQIKNFSYNTRIKYFILLIKSTHEGIIVDLIGEKYFSLICETISKIRIHKKNIIKTIAIFTNSLYGGGAERVACLLANIFNKLQYRVIIITNQSDKTSYFVNKKVEIKSIQNDNNRHQKLVNFLKLENIDLCIFNDHWIEQNFYDIIAVQICNIYTICIEHSMFYFPLYVNKIKLFLLRNAVYKNINALVTLSPCQAQMWKLSGIEQSVYIQNPLTFRKNECMSEKEPSSLLYIGKISYHKGIIDALYVVYEAKKKIKNIHLYVLGNFVSDDMKKIVLSKTNELRLTNNVSYLGYQYNITDYYKKSKILILPSAYEGDPMVLYEAKSYGLPAVIYSMPYLNYVSKKDGCINVNKKDIISMAKKVVLLLSNEQLWKIYSLRAHKCIDKITQLDIEKEWTNLFSKIENNNVNYEYNDFTYSHSGKIFATEFNDAIKSYYTYQQSNRSLFKKIIDQILPYKTKRKYISSNIINKIKLLLVFCKNKFNYFKKIF